MLWRAWQPGNPACSKLVVFLMLTVSALQVRRAKEHVTQGEQNLRQAKKIGKSTRKWMCIALVVLLIIAAIIVVVLVKPWDLGKKK
jgi:t-SNARE complex subunit (syntaxin)